MRERLVVSFVSVTLLTLAIFGVVRAYAIGGLVEHSESTRVDRSAQLVGAVLDAREAPVTAGYLDTLVGPDEQLRYLGPDGRTVVARAPGYDTDKGGVARTVRLDSGGTVTLERSRAVVDRTISDALLSVVLLAIGLAVLAAVLGYLVARRLSRPFQELARIARDLDRGRLDAKLPHFGMPEADDIARALESARATVGETLLRHRDLLLNASHELRTPITAMRLELEDLSLATDTSPAVTDQLQRSMGELDRLSSTVDTLLAATRERRVGDVDLVELVRETATRWAPNLHQVGRSIEVAGEGPVSVRLAPGSIEQVLDELVENALQNGGGTVTLDVADLDDHVRVRVRDEAPAPEQPPASLEEAREAASVFGGHLALDRTAATSYSLRLPRS